MASALRFPGRSASSFVGLVGLVALVGPVVALVGPAGASAHARPATARTAASERPALLKPNLIALKADDLYVSYTSRGRFLRFEAGMGNIGKGPMEVRPDDARPCPDGKRGAFQIVYRDVDGSGAYRRDKDTRGARFPAGCMLFHPAHDHWHFQAASRYVLFKVTDRGTERVLTAHKKMSFCLRDSQPVPAVYGTTKRPEHYGECSRDAPQGISIGWSDLYQSFLPGQAVKLPAGARDGLYCLRTKVDPEDLLVERNNQDNASLRAFTLEGTSITYVNQRQCAADKAAG